jgi:hypothetical protein
MLEFSPALDVLETPPDVSGDHLVIGTRNASREEGKTKPTSQIEVGGNLVDVYHDVLYTVAYLHSV